MGTFHPAIISNKLSSLYISQYVKQADMQSIIIFVIILVGIIIFLAIGSRASKKKKTNIKWGAFIDDIDKFDPLFFGISPLEAEFMDPQARTVLELVWKVIEDSGYKSSDLSGTNTAIFIGVSNPDYAELLTKDFSQAVAFSQHRMT